VGDMKYIKCCSCYRGSVNLSNVIRVVIGEKGNNSCIHVCVCNECRRIYWPPKGEPVVNAMGMASFYIGNNDNRRLAVKIGDKLILDSCFFV
jgi:hypothetical protein